MKKPEYSLLFAIIPGSLLANATRIQLKINNSKVDLKS